MSPMSAIQRRRVAPHGIVFIVMPYRASHSGDLAKLICDICGSMDFEGRLADEPIDPAGSVQTISGAPVAESTPTSKTCSIANL